MLRRLEQKFGKYAIVGLMRYVILLYVLGFAIWMFSPEFYFMYLTLDIDKVLQGQVWRLVTFLIQPIEYNPLFLFFSLYLYYMIGSSLEARWGSFRFNLFYFSGIFFNVLATIIGYIVTRAMFGVGVSFPFGLEALNLTLFLAFAVEYSEVRLLLFFIIPIKVKYLGIFYVGMIAYDIISLIVLNDPLAVWVAIAYLVPFLNFVIFYFATRKYRKQMKVNNLRRRFEYQQKVRSAQTQGPVTNVGVQRVVTRHKCAVCGRTELDGDDLEFRFCSKCEGDFEYCMDHLYTHTHVVRERVGQ